MIGRPLQYAQDIACFNGEALVDMADGSSKRVQDVRKGDRVKTGEGDNTDQVLVVVEFGTDVEQLRDMCEMSPVS